MIEGDPVMMVQSTIREFEDLKKHIRANAPKHEIDAIFDALKCRQNYFSAINVKGAHRFGLKLKVLKGLVVRFETGVGIPEKIRLLLFKLINKRLESMEKELIRARDKAIHSQQKQQLVRLRI